MEPIPPEYLAYVAPKIAFVSAVVGGFAATFLAQLVTTTEGKRLAEWSTGSAAFSAVLFTVATISSTRIAMNTYLSAPADATASIAVELVMTFVGFVFGIYTLLLAIGLSGWIRSRRLGIVTSLVAILGAMANTLMFVFVL